MSKRVADDFELGVFSAMQYLVLTADEPTLAKELANENGIRRDWALMLSRETGYEVRRMNKFIREELEP